MVRKRSNTLTVKPITDAHVAQYRAWEKSMEGSDGLADARRLSEVMSDVRVADAEECWRQIWTKPLYANTRVGIGVNYETKLAPLMTGAWRYIGLDHERYFVDHHGNRSAAANYSETGSLIAEIRSVSGIAARRLLAIQGGAGYLRNMVDRHGEAAPLASLAADDLHSLSAHQEHLVPAMRAELGRGWGHITTMHLLTDLGLSVKPDLHLVRTVRQLSLVDGLRNVAVPNEREGLAIVAAIVQLVLAVYGKNASPADLRYADKMLMEASLQGLLIVGGGNTKATMPEGDHRADQIGR